MSWKSIVTAGLLCFVASPALAVPTASAKVLGLDVNGNWVWQVNVTPDAALFTNTGANGTPPNTIGGSVALETGIVASNRNLVSIGKNATNFPNDDPGTAIAGFPAGPGVGMTGNNAVAFLGSNLFTAGTAQEAVRLHTAGPTSTALTTTITFSGAYTGKGRLAQGGLNNDTLNGVFNQAVKGGNANLSPNVDLGDLAILGANYEVTPGPGGKHWQNADFTGDGHVNLGDLAVLGANYGTTGTPDPNWPVAGAVNLAATPGAGSGSAVPEPTSLALIALAGLAAAFRRSRS